MRFIMSKPEVKALFRQDGIKKIDNGFRTLVVSLQGNCNRDTGEMEITPIQSAQIAKYAFKLGKSEWEDRLATAFGRHLGPKLDQHDGT